MGDSYSVLSVYITDDLTSFFTTSINTFGHYAYFQSSFERTFQTGSIGNCTLSFKRRVWSKIGLTCVRGAKNQHCLQVKVLSSILLIGP